MASSHCTPFFRSSLIKLCQSSTMSDSWGTSTFILFKLISSPNWNNVMDVSSSVAKASCALLRDCGAFRRTSRPCSDSWLTHCMSGGPCSDSWLTHCMSGGARISLLPDGPELALCQVGPDGMLDEIGNHESRLYYIIILSCAILFILYRMLSTD